MPDIKISALPTVSAVNNTDILPLVQGGITKSGTVLQVLATPSLTFVTPNLGVASATKVTSGSYALSSAGIVIDGTTSRTLSSADNGLVLYFTSITDITLTLAALSAGFSCTILQGAAGQVVFAAGGQTMTIAGGFTKTSGVAALAAIVSPLAGTFFIGGSLI